MLTGHLRKLVGTLEGDSLHYQLPVGDQLLDLNALIGRSVTLRNLGEIECIQCGRPTKKSFQQGHCYPCYRALGECGYCLVNPLKCHSQFGPCDDSHWVHANCNLPHIVYLANTSGLKVGITRVNQMPTRWIDQGASQALPIFLVANRYQSGLLESKLSEFVADKTNWRAMLKGDPDPLDLPLEAQRLIDMAHTQIEAVIAEFPPGDVQRYPNPELVSLRYPVLEYSTKINSINLEKDPELTGVLRGIKGQYVLFDQGVINIRKYGGFAMEIGAV